MEKIVYNEFFFIISFILSVITSLTFLSCFIGIFLNIFSWWEFTRNDFPFKENNNPEAYNLYIYILISGIISIFSSLVFVFAFIHYFLYKSIKKSFILISFLILTPLLNIILYIMLLTKSTTSKCLIIHQKGTNYGMNTSNFQKWIKSYPNYNSLEFKQMRCETRHKFLLILLLCFIISAFISIIFGKIYYYQFFYGK